jgi:Trk K+ transport system NAD-binding subunit
MVLLDQSSPDGSQQPLSKGNRFLVCGLGGLGQYCAAALKEFSVTVIAISEEAPQDWEVPDLPTQLDALIIGDYRQEKILEKAGIRDCKAILLVANNEQVNIEAAFAARLLNPKVRLVLRSAKQNLNTLLSQSLGNFVALEPSQLTTSAFALAALGGETQAFFSLDNQLLRVVTQTIQPGHAWQAKRLDDLRSINRRILLHRSQSQQATTPFFYQWDPTTPLASGSTLTYLQTIPKSGNLATSEIPQPTLLLAQPPVPDLKKGLPVWQQWLSRLSKQRIYSQLQQFWDRLATRRTLQLALACGLVVVLLMMIGTGLYWLTYPSANLLEAFHASAVLLLGGYGDVFGGVKLDRKVPLLLQLFSLGMALAGTAVVGVIYALLTENLLSARFHFLARRPAIPRQDHIILFGLDTAVGQKVAGFLTQFKQSIVGVSLTPVEASLLPNLPIITGQLTDALTKANLSTAKSIIVATEDEMTNLEIGLSVHAINPDAGLVIRMFDQRFSENLGQLLPYAKVLCSYGLAAEAFAGAAFGETILELFRLHNQTVLTTEYRVELGDTLEGLLLAEVAYGYDVVPLVHQKLGQSEPKWLPSDDVRLEMGERLIVLATPESLQRIERRDPLPRQWQVYIHKATTQAAVFEGVSTISLVCGCSRKVAQQTMSQLPAILPIALYSHQAHRLVRKLQQAQVSATCQALPII